MIEGFAVLLACQLAGETLARLLALPAPVAMALAERAGGIPTLAAALVICTGISAPPSSRL